MLRLSRVLLLGLVLLCQLARESVAHTKGLNYFKVGPENKRANIWYFCFDSYQDPTVDKHCEITVYRNRKHFKVTEGGKVTWQQTKRCGGCKNMELASAMRAQDIHNCKVGTRRESCPSGPQRIIVEAYDHSRKSAPVWSAERFTCPGTANVTDYGTLCGEFPALMRTVACVFYHEFPDHCDITMDGIIKSHVRR